VKLGTITAGADGTAKMWAELVEASALGDSNRFNELLTQVLKRQMMIENMTQITKSVLTDKDGRFRFSGIGADRVIFNVQATSPTIGHDQFSVMTRAVTGINIPPGRTLQRPEYRTYPSTFDHVLNPVRVVQGTVRDAATGKPIEGIQVTAWQPSYLESFTDKDGKYSLIGVAKANNYTIRFWPFNNRGKAQPYLNTTIRLRDELGLGSLTADLALVRGVVLRGRVTDKNTGEPIGGAAISYATFRDNPHVASFAFNGNAKLGNQAPYFNLPQLEQAHSTSGRDGTFAIVVLPGPGLLAVRVADGPYTAPNFPEAAKDRYYWSKTVPYIANAAEELQAVKLIAVPEKAGEISCDVRLDPGRSLSGRILDPGGSPLSGVSVTGLNLQEFRSKEPLPTPGFTVTGLTPGRTRVLDFYLPEKQLGAFVRVRAEDNSPLDVKLQKCGTLTGGVVNADGKPRPNVGIWGLRVQTVFDKAEGRGRDLWGRTDSQGKFHTDGVVPGVKYRFLTFEGPGNIDGKSLVRGVQLQAGEEKDLGDVPANAGR
jgi:hypothetical protein